MGSSTSSETNVKAMTTASYFGFAILIIAIIWLVALIKGHQKFLMWRFLSLIATSILLLFVAWISNKIDTSYPSTHAAVRVNFVFTTIAVLALSVMDTSQDLPIVAALGTIGLFGILSYLVLGKNIPVGTSGRNMRFLAILFAFTYIFMSPASINMCDCGMEAGRTKLWNVLNWKKFSASAM